MMRRSLPEQFAAWGIAVPLMIAGLALIYVGTGRLMAGLAPWSWETRQCDVVDARVQTNASSWRRIWLGGPYELTFDLVDGTTGTAYRGMAPMANRQTFWDESGYSRDLLRASPGSTVDCWVRDGRGEGEGVAYIRQVPIFILGIDLGIGLFGLLLFAGGVLVIRPGTIDRVIDSRVRR